MHTLAEDLLLLALDDDSGTVSWSRPAAELRFGLGGALLMDLALLECVEDVANNITVVAPTSTGDELLDRALETIRSSDRPKDAKHWVKTLGDQKGLKDQLARRLVERGILREETHTFLWVVHESRYPTEDSVPEDTMRDQIHATVFGNAEPDTRTLLLLSLVHACHLTDGVFAKVERKEANQRITRLVEDEQIGKAVGHAVAAVVAATTAAITAATFSTTIASGAHG